MGKYGTTEHLSNHQLVKHLQKTKPNHPQIGECFLELGTPQIIEYELFIVKITSVFGVPILMITNKIGFWKDCRSKNGRKPGIVEAMDEPKSFAARIQWRNNIQQLWRSPLWHVNHPIQVLASSMLKFLECFGTFWHLEILHLPHDPCWWVPLGKWWQAQLPHFGMISRSHDSRSGQLPWTISGSNA